MARQTINIDVTANGQTLIECPTKAGFTDVYEYRVYNPATGLWGAWTATTKDHTYFSNPPPPTYVETRIRTIPTTIGKQIKIIEFWYHLPAGHAFGFQWEDHEGEGIYHYGATGAQDALKECHEDLEDKSKFIGPVGKDLIAYFSGSGTVKVTIIYDTV